MSPRKPLYMLIGSPHFPGSRRRLTLALPFVWMIAALGPAGAGHDEGPVAADVGRSESAVAAQSGSRNEEARRERWQRVGEIFDVLGIAEGSVVADIGSGGGFFTVRLARQVGPTGRVYAVDISEQIVNSLRRRVKAEGLKNVEVLLGEPNDPKLAPASLDAALIVNAYHEMDDHRAMLKAIRRALRPGGRLVLVEPTADGLPDSTREEQARKHVLAISLAEQDLREADFEVVERLDTFIDRPDDEDEWLIVARVPPSVL